MAQQKPVRKPGTTRGCESCLFKGSDFTTDDIDPNVIRCYCKARHVNVNAEIMSKDCDFWRISPEYQGPVEDKNRYGL